LVEPVNLVEVVLPHDLPIVEQPIKYKTYDSMLSSQQNRSSNLKKKGAITSVHLQWQYHLSTACNTPLKDRTISDVEDEVLNSIMP
jgi:hypothetical protein